MTIRQKLTGMLESRGMWPDDVAKVLARYAAGADGAAMKGRLDDDESGYLDEIRSAVWMDVKREALRFIDETDPGACYRPLFVGGEPANNPPVG